MPISPFLQNLRAKIGHDLLILPSVGVIIFDSSHRVLLMQHSGTGRWVEPGGAIDPGEHPADAAVRELWEETGLHVRLTGILGVYGGPECLVRYMNGDQVNYIKTVFGGEVMGGTLGAHDEETMDLRYFDQEELQDLITSLWVKKELPRLFSKGSGSLFAAPVWTPSQA